MFTANSCKLKTNDPNPHPQENEAREQTVRQQEGGAASAWVLDQGPQNPCELLSDTSTRSISGSDEGTPGGSWVRAGHQEDKALTEGGVFILLRREKGWKGNYGWIPYMRKPP